MQKVWNSHPNLVSWAVLALGMVVSVVIAARNVGLQAGQWLAVVAATVALAGLCVWIISWEDGADEDTVTGKEQDAAAGASERAASGDV